MSHCTLTVKKVARGILHVETETQYELASTMMRVQEFYESPYEDIRGHFFTHEYYMDSCAFGDKRSAQNRTVFTYLEDWNGFNVPGEVFDQWADLFGEHYLWDKEKNLIEKVREKASKKYYVIGTHHEAARGDYDHELSHAWYYLLPKYKKEQEHNIEDLSASAYKQLTKYLMEDGYRADTDILKDEIIAYLSTNLMPDTKDMFEKMRVPWHTIYKFQKTFSEYKETHFDDEDY